MSIIITCGIALSMLWMWFGVWLFTSDDEFDAMGVIPDAMHSKDVEP